MPLQPVWRSPPYCPPSPNFPPDPAGMRLRANKASEATSPKTRAGAVQPTPTLPNPPPIPSGIKRPARNASSQQQMPANASSKSQELGARQPSLALLAPPLTSRATQAVVAFWLHILRGAGDALRRTRSQADTPHEGSLRPEFRSACLPGSVVQL